MTNKILPINSRFTYLGNNKVLDKTDGSVVTTSSQLIKGQLGTIFTAQKENIKSLSDNVDVVYALDETQIDLRFKTSDGPITLPKGFLIEVYAQEGEELVRYYRESIMDIVSDEIKNEGFEKYFTLEVE